MIRETLYLITDDAPSLAQVDAIRDVLASVPAGEVLVQLRPRRLPTRRDPARLWRGRSDRELYELACAVRAIAHAAGARLLINDRVDLALASGADGVHLPEAGLSIAEARRQLGEHAIVGASAHDQDGVVAKVQQGADLLTVSPVFATESKPGQAPLGLPGLRALANVFAQAVQSRASGGTPRAPVLFALGGIVAPEQVKQVLRHGAHGVATIRGILGAAAPAAAARAFFQASRS